MQQYCIMRALLHSSQTLICVKTSVQKFTFIVVKVNRIFSLQNFLVENGDTNIKTVSMTVAIFLLFFGKNYRLYMFVSTYLGEKLNFLLATVFVRF